MTQKLTQHDWLDFSLKELSKHGHGQLSANRLARKLGVSRGSFYWHFKDIRDFETSLLTRWAERSTEKVITYLNAHAPPKDRLLTLIKWSMEGEVSLERAIRSWAISDEIVAEAVKTVDKRRMTYIENLLRTMNVDPVNIKPRAKMLYLASIGRIMSTDQSEEKLSDEALSRYAELLVS